MAMLRHREFHKAPVPTGLLYSSRSLEDVIYREELDAMAQRDPNLHVFHTLTRKQPDGWAGHRGRIDKAMSKPNIFVCGPTSFVEHVSSVLVELGHDAFAIKTERFGPTGG